MQIIVVGCGKVGSSLAGILVDQGHDVVIVENDPDLIQNASDIDCIKITGVHIDRDVLKQAGIETADILCAVTQTDNINIMVAQIAQDVFKVPKIITRIFNPSNEDVFQAFGLNTVCSTELTVQAFLRKIADENKENIQNVCDRNIMFTQTMIDKDLIGEDITNLSADPGKLIFGLLRKGNLQLATKGIKLQAGDELVLAAME